MRLQSNQSNTSVEELQQFSEWLLAVGNGQVGGANDDYVEIEIPYGFLIIEFDDPIDAIVNNTYPNLMQEYKNEGFFFFFCNLELF